MTYFEDGSPYSYLEDGVELGLVNVGWLDPLHEFGTGEPDMALVQKLVDLAAATPCARIEGWHYCGFCKGRGFVPVEMESSDGTSVMLGDAEIRIQHPDGTWYAAPTLLPHYIEVHHYQPPAGFIEAVENGTARCT